MSFRTASSWASILAIFGLGACGGIATISDSPGDPNGAPAGPDRPSSPSRPPGPSNPGTPVPPPRVGPYDGLVGTTDVSILYPITLAVTPADLASPTDVGNYGQLLPEAVYRQVRDAPLERTTSEYPSGYSELRLVSMRLDPCPRMRTARCQSEVRLVFQALYVKAAGRENDPSSGVAALDGGVHVFFDIPYEELVTMMKEILTLKKDNGGLALQELAPHPILAAQGLGGPFARGLHDIVRYHLGETRIRRITFFDHNLEADSDGWTFGIFDRGGDTFSASKIPTTTTTSQLIFGSSALVALDESNASTFEPSPSGTVLPLTSSERPLPGSPEAGSLQAAFAVAHQIQDPTVHTTESTDCASCHLAEGARRIGESIYGFPAPASEFKYTRSLARRDERSSVTNLHAFGYLHRKVAIMQRTANESAVVATQMESLVR